MVNRLPGRPGSFVNVPTPVVDTTHSYTITACVKLNRISGYQTFVSIDGDRISGFFLQLTQCNILLTAIRK